MLGLGLQSASGAARAWWPQGALFAADLINDRYTRGGNPIPAAEAVSFSRASAKWAQRADGSWVQFAANVPARTDLGLSLEPAGTNIVPNPGLAGATVGVVGVVGAGGSLPTGWLANGVLTTEVVALTTLLGLPAIRLRISGVAAAAFYELAMMPATTPLAASTAYTASIFAQSHSGLIPTIEVRQGNASDGLLTANGLAPAAGVAASRISATFASHATAARGRIRLTAVISQGETYKFEFTLAMPQLETYHRATSPMTARPADELRLELPAGTTRLEQNLSGTVSSAAVTGGTTLVATPTAAGFIQTLSGLAS